MAGRECYHCKQWIEEGEAHDCWTTTEAALTRDLTEDLRDAWERLRETAVDFGDQRIYATHNSIMFARTSCYFFVRPKKNFLELCVFLGRVVKAPQVRRADRTSASKVVHVIQVRHRDEVEAPITEWLREAYALSDVLAARAKAGGKKATRGLKPPRDSTVRNTATRRAGTAAAAKKTKLRNSEVRSAGASAPAKKTNVARRPARKKSTRR